MPDLSTLSNDELQALAADVVHEVHARRPNCAATAVLHWAAERVEKAALRDGEVSTLSAGGPKEP